VCACALPDKNLGVFTGFLAGIAWKGTETFKQARSAACLQNCRRTPFCTDAISSAASLELHPHISCRRYLYAPATFISNPSTQCSYKLTAECFLHMHRATRTVGQVSLKNQWLVSRDWIKTKLLGRDISDV